MNISSFVPDFPQFKKLNLEDRDWYHSYYSDFQCAADLSFANLFAWYNTQDDLSVSHLNGNLIITFSDPFASSKTLCYTILGCSKPLDTILYIQEVMPKKKAVMLSESFTNKLLPGLYGKVIEDRDNWDYIYSVDKFAKMFGGEYIKIRSKLNKLLRSCKIDECCLPISQISIQKELLNTMDLWVHNMTEKQKISFFSEIKAIKILFSLQGELIHYCYGFYFNGVLEGFVVYHLPPQKGFAIVNHIRCSYKYRNMYDALFFLTVRKLNENGVSYVNLEQDLGCKGLREHKLSLRPQSFIKKYALKI